MLRYLDARRNWKSSIPVWAECVAASAFASTWGTLKRAMPDARAVIEQTVASGDTVAVEGRFTGTHTGPLATDDGDVEPTGAAVDQRFADVSRVRDGKIVAYHTYYDQLGLLTQLGLMEQTA
jgi:ketosteroid isomerase-like protein